MGLTHAFAELVSAYFIYSLQLSFVTWIGFSHPIVVLSHIRAGVIPRAQFCFASLLGYTSTTRIISHLDLSTTIFTVVSGKANFSIHHTGLTMGGFIQPSIVRNVIEIPSDVEKIFANIFCGWC